MSSIENPWPPNHQPALLRNALDWFVLEHACCPFLRLEVILEPVLEGYWLRLSGGPGVKEFLADAGLAQSARSLAAATRSA